MRTHLLPAAIAAAGVLFATAGSAASSKARPMFTVVPNNAPWHHPLPVHHPGAQLTQWNGSFTDHTGATINYTMVGTDPSNTNVTTIVPVLLIPVKMVYGAANGNMTFNPRKAKLPDGETVLKNTAVSPVFSNPNTYVQGGVNLGKTQYIDAFQRGNFWSYVSSHTKYHVKFGRPQIMPTLTYNVSPALGMVMNNPFGSGVVGTMDYEVFDQQVQTWLGQISEVNPGALPVFLLYDIYLQEYNALCCIGGYHSSVGSQPGGQTYSVSTYVDSPGAFAQDVSALSHELGEWMDDPFVDNNVNCNDNSIMEVGDPLENNPNYGDYAYTDTRNGFTYNLQSLVFIGYFGAPPSTSVNSWLSFQNDEHNVCPGQ
jgi:hypothetical protein